MFKNTQLKIADISFKLKYRQVLLFYNIFNSQATENCTIIHHVQQTNDHFDFSPNTKVSVFVVRIFVRPGQP